MNVLCYSKIQENPAAKLQYDKIKEVLQKYRVNHAEKLPELQYHGARAKRSRQPGASRSLADAKALILQMNSAHGLLEAPKRQAKVFSRLPAQVPNTSANARNFSYQNTFGRSKKSDFHLTKPNAFFGMHSTQRVPNMTQQASSKMHVTGAGAGEKALLATGGDGGKRAASTKLHGGANKDAFRALGPSTMIFPQTSQSPDPHARPDDGGQFSKTHTGHFAARYQGMNSRERNLTGSDTRFHSSKQGMMNLKVLGISQQISQKQERMHPSAQQAQTAEALDHGLHQLREAQDKRKKNEDIINNLIYNTSSMNYVHPEEQAEMSGMASSERSGFMENQQQPAAPQHQIQLESLRSQSNEGIKNPTEMTAVVSENNKSEKSDVVQREIKIQMHNFNKKEER